MVEPREFKRERGPGGGELFGVAFYPATPPKAVLVFHHGLAEHVGRYKEVFAHLAGAGVAVFAQDAWGHGKSEGERAYIENIDALVDDFVAFADYARSQVAAHYPSSTPPCFVGGHSMGGLLSALTCLRDQGRWAGLLLLSPAMDVEWTLSKRAQVVVGRLLGRFIPRARIIKAVLPEEMSADPECVKEYINDPLVTIGPLAVSTANEIIRGFVALQPHYSEFALPLLAVMGDADRCTSLLATRRFVEGVSSADKELRVIPGAYHEVLSGGDRQQVLAGITDWILAHATHAVPAKI